MRLLTSTSGTWCSVSKPRLLALLILATQAAAGEGSISGRATDPTSAAIPRLTVTLSKAASSEMLASSTTSDTGAFQFFAKAGLYDVSFVGVVSADGVGFKSETIRGVRLEDGAAVELPAMTLTVVSPCSIRIDPVPISRKSRIKGFLRRVGLIRNPT